MIWDLIKETFKEWSEDKAPKLGAALAYYTVFSIPPLLVLLIGVASMAFDTATVQEQVTTGVRTISGEQTAGAIHEMLTHPQQRSGGWLAALIGVATLVFGASGVFAELQDSLNTIWEVRPRPDRGWWGTLKDRFFSFTMVLGTCFLLLVSLVLTAMVSAFGDCLSARLPGGETLWQIVNFLIVFAVVTTLFALMFKYIPDAKVAWGDVWIGAAATAVLFTVGKFLIGLYLGKSDVASAYGAAGSLVLLLLWVYYSAQILFLGAEFTQVYANRYGSRVLPDRDAMRIPELERANQGLTRADRNPR